MQWTTNKAGSGYSPIAKLLHWAIVVLLIAQYITAWAMPHIGRNTTPDFIINLHLSIGALIMMVMAVRLLWKWLAPEPIPLAGIPPWQHATARSVHYALYVLLIVVPFLGWLNASFRGFNVSLFGIATLPQLFATRTLGFSWTGDIHILLSYYVLLPLIGLHVAAALYHEFIRKDGVLRRMLPPRRESVAAGRK